MVKKFESTENVIDKEVLTGTQLGTSLGPFCAAVQRWKVELEGAPSPHFQRDFQRAFLQCSNPM